MAEETKKEKCRTEEFKLAGGEIINCDSTAVYRGFDIGTDKVPLEAQRGIPHHLIDIVDPTEEYTAARFGADAARVIREVHARGRLPVLVGGTGFYYRALTRGLFPGPPANPRVRERLERIAAQRGPERLRRWLIRVALASARRIQPRDTKRMVRALEVYRQTNTPFSRLQVKQPPPFQTLIIGLTTDRPELYRLVGARVDEMIQRGLVAEVRKLVSRGYSFSLPSMSGIGYRQIGLFLESKLALADAVQQIKFETHRFVRHQYAWFQLKDERIHWFDIQTQPRRDIDALVAGFIAKT